MRDIHIFIAHMGIGGAERVCVTLANEFAVRNRKVHIAVLNLDNDINTANLLPGIEVHQLGVSRLRYSILPMLKYIKKHNPAFMLIFGDEMAIIINRLKRLGLCHTPLIVRVLNNVNISLAKEDRVSPLVEHFLNKSKTELKDMDVVIAQCRAMMEQLVEMKLAGAEKIRVIYNPVSEELLGRIERERALLAHNEGTEALTEVTFIGRLDPQKNVKDLIEAFCYVHTRLPECILRIVGGGVLEEQLKALVRQCGLEKSVVFEGIRDDCEKVYATSSLVVLSSLYEGMPNTLIEAIGAGIPVVSYDCPMGPAEIIREDVNGYLVPFGDTDRLGKTIVRALTRKWDRNSVRETCNNFRAEGIAASYLKIFAEYE